MHFQIIFMWCDRWESSAGVGCGAETCQFMVPLTESHLVPCGEDLRHHIALKSFKFNIKVLEQVH